MMTTLRTSDTGTRIEFLRDRENELVAVFEYEGDKLCSYYVVSGHKLEKSVERNGIKKARIEFSEPISLRYTQYGQDYTVNACARKGGAIRPTIIRSFESIDGVISFFDIDPTLLSDWLLRLKA